MWDKIKCWWGSWKNSGTIILARLQVIGGALIMTAQATDLSPIIPPKWLPVWLVASGTFTEVVRHWNDPSIRQ